MPAINQAIRGTCVNDLGCGARCVQINHHATGYCRVFRGT